MLVYQGSQASLDLKVYQDYQDLKDYQVQLALQEILDAMDFLASMVQEGVKETQVFQASQVPVVWMVPLGHMDCKVPQDPLELLLLMDSSSHVTARQ